TSGEPRRSVSGGLSEQGRGTRQGERHRPERTGRADARIAPEDSDHATGVASDRRGDEVMPTATLKIFRGDRSGGGFKEYKTEVAEGMVVLDALHQIQAEQANDLALRWNCKAGRCGSCSAEINGVPKLMCMTRLSDLPLDKPVTVAPMKAFPLIKDLVADVSWNFEVKKKIKKFKPRPPDAPDGSW